MLKNYLALILGVIIAPVLFSQNLYKFAINDSIPVTKNGVALTNPWGGGLNNPQFNEIDVNFDCVKDLVIFDRAGDILRVFINDNITDEPSYHYAPEYAKFFPDTLFYFVLLRDYNGDGKEDIFTYNSGGFRVYKNISDSTLKFKKVTDYLPAIVFGNPSGVYTITVDYPNISDVDGDGDLDILSINIWSTFVNYYENISTNPDSLVYERADGCWGNFYENQLNDSIVLGANCKSNGDDDAALSASGVQRHTGATLLALDLFANGASDLLIGDVGYTNIIRLENGGTPTAANMVTADYFYPGSNSDTIDVPTFPSTFFLDVNNNGRKDLLVSTNERDAGIDTGNVWFYDNFGADNNPNFQLDRKNLFVGDQIDVGSMAYPVLGDISGDGLPDLLIGNHGYFVDYDDNTFITEYQSQMAYYENVGDSNNPIFEFVTDDFEGFSAKGFDRLTPTLGDLDGDGDNDLIFGENDGSLSFYRNVAPAGQMADFVLVTDTFMGQLFGVQPSPFLFDVDGDNALDLLVGQKNGNIHLYINQGGTTNPVYTISATDTLGGIYNYHIARENNVMPFISTINGGTSNVLVIADGIGNLLYYDGLDNNLLGNYTLIDSMKVSNSFISVAGANLTGSDSTQLIVGQRPGGLMFLNLNETAYNYSPYPRDTCYVNGIFDVGSTHSDSKLNVYPNPNNGTFTISLNASIHGAGQLSVIDLSGKIIYQQQFTSLTGNELYVNATSLHPGVFVVQVEINGTVYRDKLVIQ